MPSIERQMYDLVIVCAQITVGNSKNVIIIEFNMEFNDGVFEGSLAFG